jgi:hypothetical protein
MSQNCFFRIHYKEFCGDAEKILNFFRDIWFEYYGELIFWDFSPCYFWINYFETRHQKQMWDLSVFRKVFCSYKTLNSKYIFFWKWNFKIINLRVSRSLNWHILDEILAKHGFKNIILISQFVELAFNLRKKFVKTFLYDHTPSHISGTRAT